MNAASDVDRGKRRSAGRDWLRALERTAALTGEGAKTLPALLEDLALAHADRPALGSRTLRLSYADLAGRVRSYARWARAAGVRPGESVGVLRTGGPDYVALWLGLLRAGAVATLFPPDLSQDALIHGLTASGTGRLLAEPGLLDPARAGGLPAATVFIARDGAPAGGGEAPLSPHEEAATSLGDVALQIFTSGTTGLPKAARLSHRRLLTWSGWFGGLLDASPDDRLYDCLPMHHSVGGVAAVGAMLVSGASVFIRDGFSASAFWSEVCAEECTLFQYIGELCRYLLAAPPNPLETRHSLRLACGNGLRGDVWEPFKARFAIPRILEFYASTEGNFSLYNVEEKVGAIGRPPAFLAHRSPLALVAFDPVSEAPARDAAGRCRVVAEGEPGEALAQITARSGFEGYADAEATEAKILRNVFEEGDAWVRSGDLLRRDAEGFYSFVDRVGDTFRWKGENVSAAEVTAAILATGLVRDVVVYGVQVPFAEGRAGMAALSARGGFDPAAFGDALTTRLAPHARPLFLRLIAAVETTSTFKPKKAVLAAEGFDPARVGEDLYVRDRKSGAYVPLAPSTYEAIASGALRL